MSVHHLAAAATADDQTSLHASSLTDPASSWCRADAFAELTWSVIEAPGIKEARHELMRRSAELMDTFGVGLTRVFDDGDLGYVGLLGDGARVAGNLEQRLGEGPAWEAHVRRVIVRCDDLARERRWPRYAAALTGSTQIRAVMALPLTTAGDVLGSLVVYSENPGHFAGERLHAGRLLAAHASAALATVAGRVKAHNLEVALRTNRDIATAVGIVMDRFRIPNDQAFAYLRELSQRRHLKLADLADRIVVSGEIPKLPSVP
jgi:GAF domain-containing protein